MARKIGSHAFHLYASKAYWRRRPRGRSLEGHDLIGFCDELSAIPPAKWLEQQRPRARVSLRTNSLLSAAEAARGGWGITALPDFVAEEKSELVRMSENPVGGIDFWIIVHPDLQHVARVRAVIDHLTATMRSRGLAA